MGQDSVKGNRTGVEGIELAFAPSIGWIQTQKRIEC